MTTALYPSYDKSCYQTSNLGKIVKNRIMPQSIATTLGLVHSEPNIFVKEYNFTKAKEIMQSQYGSKMLSLATSKDSSGIISRAGFYCNNETTDIATKNAIEILVSIALRKIGKKPNYWHNKLAINKKETLALKYSKATLIAKPTQAMVDTVTTDKLIIVHIICLKDKKFLEYGFSVKTLNGLKQQLTKYSKLGYKVINFN
jgi:hypothetical protein